MLPYDLARGAQRYARELRDRLDSDSTRHLIVTLFDSDEGVLDADIALGVAQGGMRNVGLDLRAVAKLRATIRRERPGAIIAHGGESLKYAALAAPRRLPIVYYKIGTVSARLQRPGRERFYRWCLRRTVHVAAVSHETAAEVSERFGVPADQVTFIPNGRDPAIYRPSAAKASPPQLVFVGHLAPTKRPERFVDLVAALRKRDHALRAQIVGDGPLFETLAPAAQVADVTLLGSRDDVPELLSSSDIFVFTSVSEGEGMPGVLIEAGLCGLPIVTTDVPGARTVVDDQVTGYVVAEDDFDGMVEYVSRLLGDQDLRSQVGAAARQRCEERFSIDGSVAQWDALISRISV